VFKFVFGLAAYGDDHQAAANYLLVRITNNRTGHVFYSRTHDHISRVLKSGAPGSTHFDVPATQKRGPQLNQITRKLGLSNFAIWVFFLPHSRFMNGQSIKEANKHHETKTNIYQHSGSSVRVPIDGDIRSASTELRLY
jgi:hypothetical protein